ncbi:MAG: thiamine phosphate synthase [Labilithrix sp.]|nr:thiamine phosphate synthase [Labilithrix sp.]
MTPVVFLITDPRVSLATTVDVVAAAGAAIGGLLGVQLRDKSGVSLDAARALRAATREVGAALVVNGSIAIAEAVGADGVHFPSGALSVTEARRALGEAALVTASTHDDDDVRRAAAAGVSAVLVSPIFASPGKGPPRGVSAIASAREVSAGSGVRIHALGGIAPDRVRECVRAGADGVAVIRALLDAKDPARVARELAAPWTVAGRDDEC